MVRFGEISGKPRMWYKLDAWIKVKLKKKNEFGTVKLPNTAGCDFSGCEKYLDIKHCI